MTESEFLSYWQRRRRTAVRVACLALLAIATTTACSTLKQKDDDELAEAKPATYLMVENRAFLDHTIYVLRNSQRVRIGNVTGNSSAKLLIPSNLLFAGTLRFIASPIGGNRQPVSQEISVTPGDEIQLIIPPG